MQNACCSITYLIETILADLVALPGICLLLANGDFMWPGTRALSGEERAFNETDNLCH
jgi:hypothetical protein